MADKATVNPVKVPYTPVECPKCGTEYKEQDPRQDVENGHFWSECPNGHLSSMNIDRVDGKNGTLVVVLTPSHNA